MSFFSGVTTFLAAAKRLSTLAVATLPMTTAHGAVEGAPTQEECAFRWHIPFGSPLRSPTCSARPDGSVCAPDGARVKQFDLMYSTCILVSEAAELEDRHPIETGRVMQAAVTMLKGGGDGTRPELKLSRLGGLDNQPCWVLSPPSWCRTKFLPGLQSDAAAIVREYRQHEAVLPRIGSEREQAKNYRPAKDRMTFLTYSAGAANGWVVGNDPIAAETPRDFEAFVHRGQ